MKTLSIIIPTCNRPDDLRKVLASLPHACAGFEDRVECLIMDNGTGPETKAVVADFALLSPFPVRYVAVPCPGLHVGRNRGAELARAPILAFLDDDVLVEKGWCCAIFRAFEQNPSLALMGGPCRPQWLAPEPGWLVSFREPAEEGYTLGALSLIDLGNYSGESSPFNVFGCNFIIARDVLFEMGGFLPDALPKHLVQYRGSGESGLASRVEGSQKYTIRYDRAAAVRHQVPGSRLTIRYFDEVARRTGISIAYMLFRENRSKGVVKTWKGLVRSWLAVLKSGVWQRPSLVPTPRRFSWLTNLHIALHYTRLSLSAKLGQWALQEEYFMESGCPYWDLESGTLKEKGMQEIKTRFWKTLHGFVGKLGSVCTFTAAAVDSALRRVQDASALKVRQLGSGKAWGLGYDQARIALLKNILHDVSRPLGTGHGVAMDERCVEYPWVLNELGRAGGRILDAGSALNHPDILGHPLLRDADLTILTLAPEIHCEWQRGISYIYGDLRQTVLGDAQFDIVVSLSTLEHVGMDNVAFSKDERHAEHRLDGVFLAFRELRRVLRPGGRLLFTVPYGVHEDHGTFQQFDEALLERCADVFAPTAMNNVYYLYKKTGWYLAEKDECSQARYAKTPWSPKGLAGDDGAAAARCVVCCAWT